MDHNEWLTLAGALKVKSGVIDFGKSCFSMQSWMVSQNLSASGLNMNPRIQVKGIG
jgi:hypothetical protein